MNKTIKTVLSIALAFGFIGVCASVNQAATTEEKSFVVSASVPKASGISISASSVNPSNNVFTPVVGNALSFNPMTLNAEAGIYLPDHFFAIDIGATGGAGSPEITVTYTEGNNPNGTGKGLGWKSTATFIRVEGAEGSQTEVPLTAHGPKKMLKDLSGEKITEFEMIGGFFRMYLGIVTKDTTATFPDPTDSEVFTNGDTPGDYNGTLLISATIS